MLSWRDAGVALALAGVLVACSGNDGGSPDGSAPDEATASFETRPADAPRAAPDAPLAFAFQRYQLSVDGDTPEVCLGFTAPLDPEVDYSAYVVVEPRRPVALSVSGQTLCIGGLGFAEHQSVRLRAGLPAADGSELAAEERVDIAFEDRPAYVGFAGDGVILPRLDADGLALETVNVDAVDIRLYRVTDRALAFRSITAGFNGLEGDWNWIPDSEDGRNIGGLLWEGEMTTQGAPNTPVTTVFPIAAAIDELRPGAYYVEVTDAAAEAEASSTPAQAVRWLVITDLALTAYRGADGLDFTVRSLNSARPEANVQVQLIAHGNQVLAEAVTDASGHARFAAPLLAGSGGLAPRLLLAYGPDGDFAVLDLARNPVDLSAQGIGGRDRPDAADAYLYLDRGIYRPGETVYLGGLVRDAQAVAIEDRPVTLTVFGPNGIEVARARLETAAAAGGVVWDYDLSDAAARGEWRIEASLDGHGQVGSVRFSVEDFVPQRVALELDTDRETPLLAGHVRDVEARVRFLYGAPGAGLPVEARMRVEVDPSPFEAWPDFSFGRGDETFREESIELDGTVADGAGRALVRLDPAGAGEGATQPLRLRAVISAIEPGGRPVADDVRLAYRPAELYLGLDPAFAGRADRDEAPAFEVVAVTPTGEARAAEVNWQLVRIDWNYDWYRTEEGQWRWRRSRHVVEVEDGVLNLDGGGAERLQLRQLDWGNYQLLVSHDATGMSASQDFWVGWGASAEPGLEAPDRVAVSGPGAPVVVGDTVTINILPPYPGEAEVVIAGERVIETRAVQIPEGGAQLSFEVTEDWGGGAYALVSVFTPRDPVDRPVPRRAVGVSYLAVDVSDRTLELDLNAPERALPRQTLALDVEIDGAGMEEVYLTVAAVDEGILALTRFASPDPLGHFFGKTALDVEMYDDYGRLLDPNQGAAAAIRSGGDQIGGAGLTVVPTRTVALFSGLVDVGRDGTATVELDIPDFNGELRLMAVAWTQEALGQAAEPMTVRDDVPAELVLPRFLAPGDASTATLTIDNVDGAAGTYVARMSASGAVATDAEVSLDLGEDERADRRLDLAARDAGLAEVSLAVEGPGGFAVTRSYPIQVRTGWMPSSEVERRRLSAGQTYRLTPDVIAGYLPGSTQVSVSFAPTPLDEAALLQSLQRYPYGCTEQQTSQALPLLYSGAAAARSGADEVAGARARVSEAVGSLLNRQGADGAFGLWRLGDGQASPWLGAYAVDFLLRAREAGYTVPEAALERAYRPLRHIANREMWRATGYDGTVYRWPGQSDTEERLADRSAAYALYVLARAGEADRSRLRYMHDERLAEIGSPLALAQLAMGLHLIGDRARMNSAFDAAEAALGYENEGDYYQSPRRDLAGLLALAAEAGQTERVERLAELVATDLPEPDRLMIQEKAFLLMAAHALSGGAEAVEVDSALAPVASEGAMRFELEASALGEGIEFTVGSDGSAWLTRIVHGETRQAPGPAAEGLEVRKRLWHVDGREVDPSRVTQGDRLLIELEISPYSERLVPAVIVDLLPAGFEIEAVVRPDEVGRDGVYSWIEALDTAQMAESRDDRFVAAVDLRHKRMQRLAYLVRAVTPGTYVLPGMMAEDMYRPDVFARTATGEVVIAARD
ncbi:alpha-2-macroglobulin family protein [Maricaulis sp. CAU 1757]